MNSTILEGKWTELKGRLRAQWGRLTDDDLEEIQGDAEILIGKLQQRYGHAKDRIRKEVDDWLSEQHAGLE